MKKETRKINIVFLTDCLETLAGGAEKQIFELTRRLDKDSFSVSVVSLECQGQASGELIESVGGKLHTFPVKRIYGVSGFREGRKFYDFLKKNQADILQTYHFSSDIWGTFWGHLAGVPVIISNRRDMGFWRKPWHTWAYRLINGWVKRVVVVANSVKEMVKTAEGIPESKIEVVYNGIELKNNIAGDRDALKKELGISAADPVIVHVANLKPVKGHTFLIQAMADVVRQEPQAKLLLIGKDELGGTLQALAEQLGLTKNILFLGKRQDVLSLLDIADICVLPSLSEGMSNAILEYMACRKPAVVSNVGGNPELVAHGFNGLIVPKENASELSKALIALLKDPQKRQQMGENGFRRAVEIFSLESMVRNYENFFKRLVSDKKKILHLISSGGLFGAEKVLLSISECFQGNGLLVEVGALQDNRRPHVEVIEEARKRGISTFLMSSRGRFDVKTIFNLKKYLKENRINVLHTHNYKSDMIGFFAAKLAGIPIVATAHGFTDMDHKVGLYERLDRFILKFFNKVVVMTEKMLPGISAARKKPIANGINVNKFNEKRPQRTELRKRWNLSDETVIGTIGRLSVEKNQKMLIEAFRQLPHSSRKLKLFLVGEGPEGENLRSLVDRYGLKDKVVFTGLVSDVENVYPVFDIFVLSSTTEGVPLTILEAMAAGVPVISTGVGAISNMIQDYKTGLLIDSQNVQALTEKLNTLMNDLSLQNYLREQAFEHVQKNYSLSRMCEEYRKIYEEVLS